MDRTLIGIDIGTTGLKSILVSEAGEILAHAYSGYALRAPSAGRCEQDAEDWWRALVKTVREVASGREESVAAISLSSQGGTLVPVDEYFRPLHPALVWSDVRCEEQRRQFASRFGEDYMYQKSGWKLGRGLNAMQIKWLRDNRPDVFEKTAKFLSVPDYISLRMTGRAAVDPSDAGINQLTDIRRRAYDPAILDFLGIDERMLAEIVPSGQPVGTLLPSVAEELGLPKSALLVSGAHDQYAALLGAGITRAGEVLVGTGTAWVITALTDEPDFSSGFSQSIPAAGNWGSMVAISAGGVCLDWFRTGVASSEREGGLPYSEIDSIAAERNPGANGLFFYPYFNGGAFPLRNPDCKAAFLGLDLSHDRFDIARAVMEGVAMQAAWVLESFRQKFPIPSLKLAGGASKSALWAQMVADIANCEVRTLTAFDLAPVGAAVMAGAGGGVFPSLEEGASRIEVGERIFSPDPARYAEHFRIFKRRACALSELYRN